MQQVQVKHATKILRAINSNNVQLWPFELGGGTIGCQGQKAAYSVPFWSYLPGNEVWVQINRDLQW